MNDWYYINNTETIDTPALVFYPSRMEENILLLKSMIKDTSLLRPHIKTHKSIEATLMMMKHGIFKFKCATIAEAEMLGSCLAPDVLLAYQPVGPKISRFINLIKRYPSTKYSCLVDNFDSAAAISSAGLSERIVIPVYIDLNVGMGRTGIKPELKAVELFELCSLLYGILPLGFHFYDGHIRQLNIKDREKQCKSILLKIKKLQLSLQKEAVKPVVIGGGSPTFPIYAKLNDIECSPGTFILWDAGYQKSLPEQRFLPAAVVLTRVISIPEKGRICVDLGYKSIASENALQNRVRFLNAPDLRIISHSEEHMVLESKISHKWKVGDLLYGLPVHICPTCALYEKALISNKGEINESWKIVARDRKITI